jgi:hypothetical protein
MLEGGFVIDKIHIALSKIDLINPSTANHILLTGISDKFAAIVLCPLGISSATRYSDHRTQNTGQ